MKILRCVYLAASAASFIYFLVIGGYARFGLSISWIWPALGLMLLAAGLSTLLPLPAWVRWSWRGLFCAGLIVVALLESLVISGMHAAAPAGLDYLIVLGARVNPEGPSPALTRRLNAVMACLDDHPDAVIIASGGRGVDEPISEAQCIRDELVRRGVDPARIVVEDRSEDTRENIANSKAIIGRDDARVGIVTNNFHVYRAMRLARRAGFTNAWGIAAEYTGPTLFHFMIREAMSITVAFLKGYI